jgi:transcriptional regulator with XRE-family HTH domain/sulfur relay (sulfurtransferase) DsrF/TusC family protein
MKTQTDLREILKKGILTDELDLERALILDGKLRLIVKQHPELLEDRKKLRTIIKSYEQANWNSNSIITDKQLKESDDAEFIAEQERKFLENRKEIIKICLSKYNMTQQDLGILLGHGKTYMSELMNGISPFSNKDLIILHRLFHIELENLIPTIISQKEREKLKKSIIKLNKPMLKLEKVDLGVVAK